MVVRKVSVAPEYLSFYIAGTDDVDVPIDYDLKGLVFTRQCITVGCLYWNDGDTTITLGPFDELPDQGRPPRFDGMLETPERRVDVFDAIMPHILSMDVSSARTRVRIWTNHKTEPDDVVIALE